MTIPGRIPWVAHRVAVSGHYHDPLSTILTSWSLADLVDANDVCDALDDALDDAADAAAERAGAT